VTRLRHGPIGLVRDGAFLVVIAAIGLALAGGVLAADRAVDSALPKVEIVATDMGFQSDTWTVTAGQWTVIELRNDDTVIHDWMVDGVPNLDVIARPGQTAKLRFVLDTPGQYRVTDSAAGHGGAGLAGTLVVKAP
jgi:uncharacterized cupredoxin-like copper-binding protein